MEKPDFPGIVADTTSLPGPTVEDERMKTYIETQGREVTSVHDSKARILEIMQTVHENPDALKLINETLNSVFRYVEAIYTAEVTMQIAKYRMEGEEYRQTCEQLDRRRSQAHEALISTLTACNRYLFENFEGNIPVGGICTADPTSLQTNKRLAIADWAIELEYEILQGRTR